ESRASVNEPNVVAREHVVDRTRLAPNHVGHMSEELLHRRTHSIALCGIAGLEAGTRVDAANGFAEGLGRNRPGVDADATRGPLLLDDGRAFAEFGRLDRGPLTRGSASDADEVVVETVGHGPALSRGVCIPPGCKRRVNGSA